MLEPLYTFANCKAAYQLHWTLTLFAKANWPNETEWKEPLSSVIEPDGVRLLEFRRMAPATGQFFVSTKPEVSPAMAVRSIKGRLQYLLRAAIPQLWKRNYAINSVGDANSEVLNEYVAGQVDHHPQADHRVVERLRRAQFHDAAVDLIAWRSSSHGKFVHSLQVVLENVEHLVDVRQEWLEASRAMVIGACQKKKWLLSRLAIVGNHLHMIVGCDVTDAPRDVALSLMNNLAFAHGMKWVYEPSFYVGTFGPYDHDAIRQHLVAGQ